MSFDPWRETVRGIGDCSGRMCLRLFWADITNCTMTGQTEDEKIRYIWPVVGTDGDIHECKCC